MIEEIMTAFETTGGRLFYGGLAGMALAFVLAIIFAAVFSSAKKRLVKKIDSEFNTYDEKEKNL